MNMPSRTFLEMYEWSARFSSLHARLYKEHSSPAEAGASAGPSTSAASALQTTSSYMNEYHKRVHVVARLYPPLGYSSRSFGASSSPSLISTEFNSKFPLVAAVFNDMDTFTFVVMSYGGHESRIAGRLLYHYTKAPKILTSLQLSWSPDGKTLMMLEKWNVNWPSPDRSPSHSARVKLFQYDDTTSELHIHELDVMFPNVHREMQTCRTWTNRGQLILITSEGDLQTVVNNYELDRKIYHHTEVGRLPLGRNARCLIVCNETLLWIEECARQGHNHHSLVCTQALQNDVPYGQPKISYRTMYGYVMDMMPDRSSRNGSSSSALILVANHYGAVLYDEDRDEEPEYNKDGMYDDLLFAKVNQPDEFSIIEDEKQLFCENPHSPWLGKASRTGWELSLGEIDTVSGTIKRLSSIRDYCFRYKPNTVMRGGKKPWGRPVQTTYRLACHNKLTAVATYHGEMIGLSDHDATLIFYRQADLVQRLAQEVVLYLHPFGDLMIWRRRQWAGKPFEILITREASFNLKSWLLGVVMFPQDPSYTAEMALRISYWNKVRKRDYNGSAVVRLVRRKLPRDPDGPPSPASSAGSPPALQDLHWPFDYHMAQALFDDDIGEDGDRDRALYFDDGDTGSIFDDEDDNDDDDDDNQPQKAENTDSDDD